MNDIKDLILDKAKERMERFGFRKTTMDEISKDCSISKKTIYEHFADKEELFGCLLYRECQGTIRMLFDEPADMPDPLEKLTLLIRRAVAYFNQDHFITRILKDEEMFLALVNTKYRKIIDEEIITSIVRVIREGKQQGKLRDVDEQIVAYAGFRLFQSFSYARTWPLAGAGNEPYFTEVLVDFIINALQKK
ncbi:MAG TPA: TetR/AcrR family transcriptional regulator [Methylomusa anaerophila]|uniref:Bacterial regulatory proteins, tetR family n=1 Tax=Methylomusa anaerophila TaxID=1930071 RepID=A0A348AGK4_9FIRM|nr:TetR/AcrR family transcriptional regulator [Methylomusa anaerophila]BBB90202.1 bacterial regulatory proteins, tetR family [Methylomusa anaerophila]HML88072.1 TetR/AcrR family transcriptional regulator [Methylomusa anaerophila]